MSKFFFSLLLIFKLVNFSEASIKLKPRSVDPLENDSFSFQEPSINDLKQKLILWGTYYNLPEILENSGDIPLRDMQGNELGPKMSLKDWCDSAMEGSVRIISENSEPKTYNYAGVTADNPVDCTPLFKFDVSKTKFRLAKGPYGDGVEDFILIPYRTVATDLLKIPTGTVLYIPSARGAKIIHKNGRIIIHDGFFFAGDKGGAIKENHIDVYIAQHKTAPFFPWIKSNSAKTFEAYIVTDPKIINDLYNLHLNR